MVSEEQVNTDAWKLWGRSALFVSGAMEKNRYCIFICTVWSPKEYVTGQGPSCKLCLSWVTVNVQMAMLRKSTACYSMFSPLCSISSLTFAYSIPTQEIICVNPHFDHCRTDPVPDLLLPSTTAGPRPGSLKASWKFSVKRNFKTNKLGLRNCTWGR